MMKNSVILVRSFLIVSVITTGSVVVAQAPYGEAQAEKQKPAAKPHTMTGCLEKGTEPSMFRLTNVEGTGPKTAELHAERKLKLDAHVGHKVAITLEAIEDANKSKLENVFRNIDFNSEPNLGQAKDRNRRLESLNRGFRRGQGRANRRSAMR
jgi:hypothetical protein